MRNPGSCEQEENGCSAYGEEMIHISMALIARYNAIKWNKVVIMVLF